MSRRRPDRPALAGALALAATLAAPPLAAQSGGWTAGAGAVFETYGFADAEAAGIETLSLLTVPVAARFALHPSFEVTVGSAFARGSLTAADGTEATVSGPTDTSVRGTWTSGADRFVLSAAAFLPTGSSGHTGEEARVAGAVASDLLPFRISNWGTGGGADVSAAFAVPAGDFALGTRVGYRYVAEYEPLDDATFRYDPGDELYVRVALDRTVDRSSKLSLAATWQSFSEDASGGTNLFQSGDRLQGTVTYVFPAGSGSGWAYGGVLHRSSGAFLEVPQEFSADGPPSQDVLFAGGGARVLVGGTALLPGVDARVLRTGDGVGQGWNVGVGGSAEIAPGEGTLRFVPTARARFGSVVVREDVESGFTGFELGLTIRRAGR